MEVRTGEDQFETRTQRLRRQLLSAIPTVCSERARLVTQSYIETEALPISLRRAKALAKVLDNMSIFILADELIVGNQASKQRSAPVFPELGVDWIEEELNSFETRPQNRLQISEETKAELKKIFPYWKGKTVSDKLRALLPKNNQLARENYVYLLPHEKNALGHVALDFPKVLHLGFEGIKRETEENLSSLNLAEPEDLKKKSFLEAIIIVCDATIRFANRYSDLATKLAEKETDLKRRKELETIARVCKRVPARPAETFQEALQSFWFAQLIPQIESNGFSITPGRFDQYMYLFYKRDLEKGRLSQEEAQELLECLWIKFSEIIHVDDKVSAIHRGGYPLGQNLVIGGKDREGKDATNALSYMCLEAHAKVRLLQPNFTVRLHKGTPEDFLLKVGEVISLGTGMPQLLNDEIIIPSLLNRGIPLKEARNYVPVGCDEITVLGTWGRCNGGYLNLAKVLEFALNDGKCRVTGKPIAVRTGDPKKFSSYDEVWEAYKKQLTYCVKQLAVENNLVDLVHAEMMPLPFVSALVDDCIERGKDVTEGGARYNFTGPIGVGVATVGDSLAVLKKLVFEDNLISMSKLIDTLNIDFEGEEAVRQLCLNRAPKYGNDIDYVDLLTVDAINAFFDEVEQYRNGRGGEFIPALFSLSAHIMLGKGTGATPNGRKAGTPLSDGVSPTNGCDRKGPTAVLKSVVKLDLIRATNGVIFNQRFSPNVVQDRNGMSKLKDLLRTFVDLGGFHWQFNVVSTEMLKNAQKHPENYRDLVVRVAGYSAFFIELGKEVQDSIISRTEQEL